MNYEWIEPYDKGDLKFLGAYVVYSKNNRNMLISKSGTTLALDDELLDQIRNHTTSGELDFKLAQRYFATAKNKPFVSLEYTPNVTFFLIDMTQKCNLDCCYCLRDTNCHRSISDKTLTDICNYIIEYCKSKGIKNISIQPWGGEPLIELDKVLLIRSIFNKTNIQCEISMETNGTLITDEVARKLWENNIKLGVSIDGPKDINDVQRTYVDGEGTYEDIVSGIKNLQKYYGDGFGGISVITKYNVNRLDELLDHAINDLHLRSLKFNIVRDNLFAREQGLTPSMDDVVKFNVDLFHSIVEINKEKDVYFDANIDIKLCNLLYSSKKSCCLSYGCQGGYRIISFNTQGEIFPCDMTDVNSVRLGSIYDGRALDDIIVENAKTNKYFAKRETEECDSCPWQYYCKGGCSARKIHCGYGGYDIVECAINKAVYPEYVKFLMEEGDAYKRITSTPQFKSCLEVLSEDKHKKAYLAISNPCNLNCKTCPAVKGLTSEFKFLSLEEVKAFVEHNGMTNGDRITLSGGEPTENPQFLEIVDYLTRSGIYITVLSNSNNFSDDEFVNRFISIVDRPNVTVTTAIHSYDAKVHDDTSTVHGSFDRTVKALSSLYAANIEVNIKILITKKNYRMLVDTCKFIHERYPKSMVLLCSMDYSGNAALFKDELYASFEEIQESLEAACDFLIGASHPFGLFEMPLCSTSSKYWPYNMSGLQAPSLNKYPGSEDKENVEITRCNTDYAECRTCSKRDRCIGLWPASYALSKGSLPRPIKPKGSV